MTLATTANSGLTAALKPELTAIVDDIRQRVLSDPEVQGRWRADHAAAVRAERTAGAWTDWLEEQVTQAAVGWVLGSVFVRFCEDNRLLGGQLGSASAGVWLTETDPDRRQLALDAEREFYLADPDRSYRHWLLEAFDGLGAAEATRELVGNHSAIRLASPSADAVHRLFEFWRGTDDDNNLIWSFADPELSTRFLGDLYQDLSEYAKDKYALLQTPEFVEEFILDRTLTPALNERPLVGFKLIDPTCGSGHFLLGAFHRILNRWHEQEPGLDSRERVKRALDSVYGVDLNPFAVAIARFRLLIAAVQAAEEPTLIRIPDFVVHVAVGDSLLNSASEYRLGDDGESIDIEGELPQGYRTEDLTLLRKMLVPGTYDAVVGNPPYIVARDRALNARYRSLYKSCKGNYALTVPFMERFFGLAKSGERAGWVGQITSNSFMKRLFGSKLIEEFLAYKDLRLIVDTAGAFIPGHGTPTVILIGRNDTRRFGTVRAVLGIHGEPSQPKSASNGLVWNSIVNHFDQVGFEDEWLSVTDVTRSHLSNHPWSLSGGAASTILLQIKKATKRSLSSEVTGAIGFASFPGLDDAFIAPPRYFPRRGITEDLHRQLIVGEVVRDWSLLPDLDAFTPYTASADPISAMPPAALIAMWPFRTILGSTKGFGGVTKAETTDSWWSWYRWVPLRYRVPLGITFAFVATHNHFVFDRGGNVYKQTAPVIKLSENASESDHLRLLGLLNSSTGGFWLKENSHDKGNGGIGGGIASTEWERFYELTGTVLMQFPLADGDSLARSQHLDLSAHALGLNRPMAVLAESGADREALTRAEAEYKRIRRVMIAEQEELDWEVYGLYGLPGGDLVYEWAVPEINLGERAFEIALARRVRDNGESTEWFKRHGSTPITEIPEHWPADYQVLVQQRLELIESDRFINLLERPEYKRRWQGDSWATQLTAALRDHLLDQLESRSLWFDEQGRPRPLSVQQLADIVETEPEFAGFRDALDQWAGQRDAKVAPTLTKLLDSEHVPYLAAFRYKDSGLRKRAEWEQVWAAQRDEDAGRRDPKTDPIAVPPKYTGTDFVKQSFWSHRGKLDVPKERFISYPGAGRDTDPSIMLGWAGWNHAEQGLALAILYSERSSESFNAAQLTPLLAGIEEQLPWVRQWHSGEDPVLGVDLGDYLGGQVESWCAQVGIAREDLPQWCPPATTGRGRARKAATAT